MALLEARNISHAYRRFPGRRRTSLSGVDLALDAGQCLGLVGPNGSGKSTLLRILAGLAVPATGTVGVSGHAAGSRAARRATAFVPESLRWPPQLTVLAALRELAALATWRQLLPRIDRVARVAGIQDLLNRRLGSLSMGQARRVVMAQALLDDASLMLLDEPFSSLDSLVIHDLCEELQRRKQAGAAVVISSHRVEDLARLADRILVLRGGRVVAEGSCEELLAGSGRRSGLVDLLGETSPASGSPLP
jgi:ABC-type multidrug transport system ATPase subunit